MRAPNCCWQGTDLHLFRYRSSRPATRSSRVQWPPALYSPGLYTSCFRGPELSRDQALAGRHSTRALSERLSRPRLYPRRMEEASADAAMDTTRCRLHGGRMAPNLMARHAPGLPIYGGSLSPSSTRLALDLCLRHCHGRRSRSRTWPSPPQEPPAEAVDASEAPDEAAAADDAAAPDQSEFEEQPWPPQMQQEVRARARFESERGSFRPSLPASSKSDRNPPHTAILSRRITRVFGLAPLRSSSRARRARRARPAPTRPKSGCARASSSARNARSSGSA